ncbi:MAG: hypothetical protein ACLFT3_15155 [Cyclobacteriaceae bacterium]
MNKLPIFSYLLMALLLLAVSCAPPKKIGTQQDDTYEENIARLRAAHVDSLERILNNEQESVNITANPETPIMNASIPTENAIDEKLDEFLDIVTERNAEENTYQGYTVQVYTGTSREKANDAKNTVYSALTEDEASPAITFDPPNYKVKVGEFTTRLDAQPVYTALKEHFQTVLIVPERFPIVRD